LRCIPLNLRRRRTPLASFTFSYYGPQESTVELRQRLTEVGVALGYGGRRGENAGRGAAGALIRDISEGALVAVPYDRLDDLVWLADQLVAMAEASPERGPFIKGVLEAIAVARRMEAKGRIAGRGEKDEDGGEEA
jgi:hypothetical protein